MANRTAIEKFSESKDFLSPIQYNLLKTLDNIE